MKRPDIVRRIAEVVHRIAPDAKTILYGSEARGDAQVDSDIDLLILLDGDHLAPEREFKVSKHISLPVMVGINAVRNAYYDGRSLSAFITRSLPSLH